MLYDLYFHDDFDGRAAGAVMLAFLRSRGDDVEHFQPLGYYLINDYLKVNFFTAHRLFKGTRNPAIVVDFPFHPKAAWWFDHHGNPFRKKAWQKKFKLSRFLHFNPAYASCCGQVATVFKKEFGWTVPAHMRDMIRWGNIIDGAQYRSARQTIELKEPALQIDAFFDRYGRTPVANKTFVTLLAEKSLVEVARRAEVRRAVRKAKRENSFAINYIKENLTITGRVGHLFFQYPELTRPRFIPYDLYPRLLYLVRVFKKDGEYKLSIGQNPWRKKEGRVNIGQLISKYAGGGGHFGVGAAEFKTKQKAEEAMRKMVACLVQKSNAKR